MDSTDSNIKCSTNYTVKNFNDEMMEIFWDVREKIPDINVTMFYSFDEGEWKQCPQYILDEGYNTACLFQIEGEDFQISIRDTNGTKELYSGDMEDSSLFFQPNPPENVTFQWADEEVTIKCKRPIYQSCMDLELQYKSRFDQVWQSRENKCCKIEIQGIDPMMCYSFRLRLKFPCGVYKFSEWGAESFWKNGNSIESCDSDDSKPDLSIVPLLTLAMAGLLILFVFLLCICRLKRIRKTLMPVIPDPKNIYTELFSDHNGNFQEWISKTENALVQTKLESVEEECIIEEGKGEDLQVGKCS
ncbi:cytokine receptor-like factor 2 [Elgaria multicarinata webbii]|uniref:cytokine receptor-like factor 2 n=1 Tax=Elgaria multicarinata webbii TaxID=159646 RepID=UPI002FCD1E7F